MRPSHLRLPFQNGATKVRWLGTAGFAIEHADHVLLIDPYLTRAPLSRCLFAPLQPDEAVLEELILRANAIVVGHTHFDHALDVPCIARRTGALVFGSPSAMALCRAGGVPERQLRVPQEDEVGPFRLRFFASEHSRFFFGRVPFAGEIAVCDQAPLHASRYRCGAVFGVQIEVAGRRIVHLGSAQLVDASAPRADADLLLLCAAGWQSSRDLPERVARAFNPRTILLSHWDNFFRPIDRPARALPGVELPRLAERLSRAAAGARVGLVPLLGEVRV